MKSVQVYQELKDLAEKLDIRVSEQNLQKTGVRAKSGFCRIKGEKQFIMDKRKSIQDKNMILASFLRKMPHEDIFVVPAVREMLNRDI